MVVLRQLTQSSPFEQYLWVDSYPVDHPKVFQATVWDEVIFSSQGKYQFGKLTLRRKCNTAQFSRKSENRLNLRNK